MGREKNNLYWDWTTGIQGLNPIKALKKCCCTGFFAATIFCQCKKECTKVCSCRKAGFYCSRQSYENVPEIIIQDEEIRKEMISIIDQMITKENENRTFLPLLW